MDSNTFIDYRNQVKQFNNSTNFPIDQVKLIDRSPYLVPIKRLEPTPIQPAKPTNFNHAALTQANEISKLLESDFSFDTALNLLLNENPKKAPRKPVKPRKPRQKKGQSSTSSSSSSSTLLTPNDDLSSGFPAAIPTVMKNLPINDLSADESCDVPHLSLSSSPSSTSQVLPATSPVTFLEDGIEYMRFTYSSKGKEHHYKIRIDISHEDDDFISVIPKELKDKNCLYPRAFCDKNDYRGNRWKYETRCNRLGWSLVYRNPSILVGKRGLLQRAVDSYCNRLPGLQSRRAARQKKLMNGTLRKRVPTSNESPGTSPRSNSPKVVAKDSLLLPPQSVPTMWMNFWVVYEYIQCLIRIDLVSVDINNLSEEFKIKNAVYQDSIAEECPQHRLTFPLTRERELYKHSLRYQYNVAGWQLASLNLILQNNLPLLQSALDTLRSQFTMLPNRDYLFMDQFFTDFTGFGF